MTKLYKAIRNGLRNKIEDAMSYDLQIYNSPDDCGNTDNRADIYPNIVGRNCKSYAECYFEDDIREDFDFCNEIADAILNY